MVMKEGTKTLSLRIPGELKFEVDREAVRQSRSTNNLIMHILKQYLDEQKRMGHRK